MKYIPSLVGVLLFATAAQNDAQAQTFAQNNINCNRQVSITLRSAKDSTGIIAASVSANKQNAQTDLDGKAIVSNLCNGIVHLHASADGFAHLDTDISLGQENSFTFYLNPRNTTLDNVEIIGHQKAIYTNNASEELSTTELNKLRGGTLGATISKIAGVDMLQTGGTISKPIINGLHSNRILILNNGIRQEGQQWGAEHGPEIDPFSAGNITVVKGAEAVRYGSQAIGGVVLVNPPALPTDGKQHIDLSLSGYSNGRGTNDALRLSGQLPNNSPLSYSIQGSYRYAGNLKSANYFLSNTGVKELNYSGALGYKKQHWDANLYYSRYSTDLGIFQGSSVGSVSDLKAAIARGVPADAATADFRYNIVAPKQHINHSLLKAEAHVHLSDYFHLTATYGYQYDRREEYDKRRGGRESLPSLSLGLQTQTGELFANYLHNAWNLQAGINTVFQDNVNDPATLTVPLIPDYISYGAGAFFIAKYAKQNYELSAGLRADQSYLKPSGYNALLQAYGTDKQYFNTSASLGGRLDIGYHLTLSTNIATAFRPPSVNELYSTGLHHGAAAIEFGDSTLKSEQSYKWINGLTYRNTAIGLIINADAFYNYFKNYIYLQPSGTFYESLRGAFPVYNTKHTRAQLYGADLTATYTYKQHWSYELNAALVQTRDLVQNRYLPYIPPAKLSQHISFTHDLSASIKNAYLSLGISSVAQQRRYDDGSDFAPPPAGYNLLDAAAGLDFTKGAHKLNVNLSISNLANTEYKDYLNRFRYFGHDLGRNITVRLNYSI